MARAIWQATIVDTAGNIQPGANVTVRDADTNVLAPLFNAREGGSSIGNPFAADAQGFAQFYTDPGRYKITATFAASSRTWDHVVLLDNAGGGTPETEAGDFLIDLDGAGLTAENFATLVRTYANVPYIRGACFTGGGRAVDIGVNDVSAPVVFDSTITKVIVLTTGGPGDLILDVWKKAYSGYPPTVSDSITGGNKPSITAGHKYQDSTLTDWTTAVSTGDVLRFHVEDTSAFTQIAIFLVLSPIGAEEPSGYTDARTEEIVREILEEGGVTIEGDTYTVTATGASGPINLWTLVGQPAGEVTVNYTTPPGGIISHIPGTPALDLRGFAEDSVLNITLAGPVLGCPGEGGEGCAIGNTFGEDGGSGRRGVTGNMAQPGRNGGPAIVGPGAGVEFNLSAIGGYAFGGGGGGGGGGGSLDFGGDTNAAAGGGGGAGVGGARGGRAGRVAAANTSAASTATGNPGGDSTGGLNGDPGTGGTGAGNGTAAGGTGGDGGDWGADGTDGASPTTHDRDYAGGTKGTGGKAIDLNGGSVTITDGNDSTHIKGAVS